MKFAMAAALFFLALGLSLSGVHAQGRPQQAQKGLAMAKQKAAPQAQWALSGQKGLCWAQQKAAPQAQAALLKAMEKAQQGKATGQQKSGK